MDHPLESHLSVTARNFLSTSPSFEPYIPNSQHNVFQALFLLGHLAEITRQSMQLEKHSLQPPVTNPIAAPPTSLAKPQQLEIPKEKILTQKQQIDQRLIQALLELRTSKKPFQKNPGTFSSILRARPV